jgi:hypothetical protein
MKDPQMIRHELEITFGMDGVSLSIEQPAEFVLSAPDERKAALTTRTGGNLRTFSLSSNDFTMEEASPLTGLIVEVESPDDLLKCSLGQVPADDRHPGEFAASKDPDFAVKVCVDGKKSVVIEPTDKSTVVFDVPLPPTPKH